MLPLPFNPALLLVLGDAAGNREVAALESWKGLQGRHTMNVIYMVLYARLYIKNKKQALTVFAQDLRYRRMCLQMHQR
jgi:hypothetical protein